MQRQEEVGLHLSHSYPVSNAVHPDVLIGKPNCIVAHVPQDSFTGIWDFKGHSDAPDP